ncbi:unnamed protein product [Sphacelaria rigidula]
MPGLQPIESILGKHRIQLDVKRHVYVFRLLTDYIIFTPDCGTSHNQPSVRTVVLKPTAHHRTTLVHHATPRSVTETPSDTAHVPVPYAAPLAASQPSTPPQGIRYQIVAPQHR